MNIIGVQFLRNSISVAYYAKGRLMGKTVSMEEVMEDSDYIIILNKILIELKLSQMSKYKVVLSMPHELIEVIPLKQLTPMTKKVWSKTKKKELILGQIESLLEKSVQEYMIEYDIIDEKQLYNGKLLTTIINAKLDDCLTYLNKVTALKNLVPIAIDTEYEGLRRLIPDEYEDIAVINFFKDDRDMVGIYVYKSHKLIGIRYLYKNLYDAESLANEVERMIVYCKTFYRDFEPTKWFLFGTEEDIEELSKLENVELNDLATCSFAVSAGLALKEEYEKRKLRENKKSARRKGGDKTDVI